MVVVVVVELGESALQHLPVVVELGESALQHFPVVEFALKGSGVLCSTTTQPCDLKHYGFKKSSRTFSRGRVAG